MTKAEALICGWSESGETMGFVRNESLDYFRETKHPEERYPNGVPVRVYTTNDGFALHCDNWWGDSILYYKGRKIGNFEFNYEMLPGKIAYIRANG